MKIDRIVEELVNKTKEIKLTKLIQSPIAYTILDNSNAPDSTWQFGGCRILAEAISIYFKIPVYVVYNENLKQVEHFIVKINTQFIDSDGIQSGYEIMKKITDDLPEKNQLVILPYNLNLNSNGIPEDKLATQKLVELFKTYKIRNI